MLVDAFIEIQAPPRRVRKMPGLAVEARTLVDHYGVVRIQLVWSEDDLPSITIRSPGVENQHPAKIQEVANPSENAARQKVIESFRTRIDHELRAKAPAVSAGSPAMLSLNAQVGREMNQIFAYDNNDPVGDGK